MQVQHIRDTLRTTLRCMYYGNSTCKSSLRCGCARVVFGWHEPHSIAIRRNPYLSFRDGTNFARPLDGLINIIGEVLIECLI